MTATHTPLDASADDLSSNSTTGAARRADRWVSGAVDGLAIAALAALLLYLAGRDGGAGLTSWHLSGVVALSLLPAAIELRRVPGAAQAVTAVWALAALAAVVFAVDRSDFVEPTLVYVLMPAMALSTVRLLRRPWGRLVLVGLLTVSLALYWQRSFMQWWGYALSESETRWLPLSWHNQAATLMGTFGVFFFAMATATRRTVAAAAGLLGAMALAGAWLAGSRGAVVAVILGLATAAWLAGRWQGWRRTASVAVAVMAVAAAVAAGLLAMDDQAGRVTSDQGATHNLFARFDHMHAAGRMLISRPITGHGPGSYATSARAHTSPDANLTASPHNELLEPFAEGGVVFGLAVLAGVLVAVGPSWRMVAGSVPTPARGPDTRGRLEAATQVAAAAATVVLLSHAVVDFDWHYPVLAGLLAVIATMAWQPASTPAADAPGRPRTWVAGVAVVALVALFAAGLAGAWTERQGRSEASAATPAERAHATPAWDSQGNARTAINLLRDGHPDAAAAAVARTRRWNAGVSELGGLEALIEVEQGERDPEALLAAFEPHPTRLNLRLLAAERRIEAGDPEVAADLLDDALAVRHAYSGWGVTRSVARSWQLRLDLRANHGSCDDVGGLLAAAHRDPVLAGNDAAHRFLRSHAAERCEGFST